MVPKPILRPSTGFAIYSLKRSTLTRVKFGNNETYDNIGTGLGEKDSRLVMNHSDKYMFKANINADKERRRKIMNHTKLTFDRFKRHKYLKESFDNKSALRIQSGHVNSSDQGEQQQQLTPPSGSSSFILKEGTILDMRDQSLEDLVAVIMDCRYDDGSPPIDIRIDPHQEIQLTEYLFY
jgi:hypothetical protein